MSEPLFARGTPSGKDAATPIREQVLYVCNAATD